MSDFDRVTVADFWGDNGTVAVDTSALGTGVPVVLVHACDEDQNMPSALDFTPSQAREFAAAILAAADHIDPDGAHASVIVDQDGDTWKHIGNGHYNCDGMYDTRAGIADNYGIRETQP